MVQTRTREEIAAFYSNFFDSALRAVFLNGESIRLEFLEKSASDRRAIEDEIRRQARSLGEKLATKLDEAGYLEKEPPRAELERLVRETLTEGA